MTTYIALFNLTDAGIKAAKDSPRRLDPTAKHDYSVRFLPLAEPLIL
jgi:uncharacterized protein with GYD domain